MVIGYVPCREIEAYGVVISSHYIYNNFGYSLSKRDIVILYFGKSAYYQASQIFKLPGAVKCTDHTVNTV